MAQDLSKYRDLYLETARDLEDLMKQNLSKIEEKRSGKLEIDEIHRAAHSLKSQSLVMGYPQLGLIAKNVENLFFQIKTNKTKIDNKVIESTKRALTSIEYSLDNISYKNIEADITAQIREIEENIETIFQN